MQFTTFSGAEISKLAEVQVYKGLYYDTTRKPIDGGLLDPRMVRIIMGDSRFMLTDSSFFCLCYLLLRLWNTGEEIQFTSRLIHSPHNLGK